MDDADKTQIGRIVQPVISAQLSLLELIGEIMKSRQTNLTDAERVAFDAALESMRVAADKFGEFAGLKKE